MHLIRSLLEAKDEQCALGKERDVHGQRLSLGHQRAYVSIPDERLHSNQVREEWNLLDLRKELFFADWSVEARKVEFVGVTLEDGLVADLLLLILCVDATCSKLTTCWVDLVLETARLIVVIEDKAESFALNCAEKNEFEPLI